jgi:hypothetical protein
VRILSEKGVVAFLLRGPLDELEEARTAFEGMVETVRLP